MVALAAVAGADAVDLQLPELVGAGAVSANVCAVVSHGACSRCWCWRWPAFRLQKISDRVTVIYLLDQSESIPKPTREAMLEYVDEGRAGASPRRATCRVRRKTRPASSFLAARRRSSIRRLPTRFARSASLESLFELRTDATNIASALKLAQASFPEDSAKRIVIVTDGNENLGDARHGRPRRSPTPASASTSCRSCSTSQAEVAVEKIALPPRHSPRPADRSPRRRRELHEAEQRESDRRGERAAAGDAAV